MPRQRQRMQAQMQLVLQVPVALLMVRRAQEGLCNHLPLHCLLLHQLKGASLLAPPLLMQLPRLAWLQMLQVQARLQ